MSKKEKEIKENSEREGKEEEGMDECVAGRERGQFTMTHATTRRDTTRQDATRRDRTQRWTDAVATRQRLAEAGSAG
ncbi:hypothetical protein LSTR_LSTR012740 [Laodelphax striatellus]|uniref:Uncharacterized protein n=1 Tax=Laodelphax striatellus TaxID=195883 RepID=A0A482X8B8_LAOST|nr:hypothetical protein LSTR_LSTR012740 [Laodelphax striatellus]